MTAIIPQLQTILDSTAMPGIAIGHRLIAEGDEMALLPEEFAAFAGSVTKVRRASGAARIVARKLLLDFGEPVRPIPKSTAGMPLWPDGIVGSMAHDARVAVAAMARRSGFASIGVDVEPAEPLDPDLLDIVATDRERRDIQDDPLHGRVLFSVKESVYKAVYPLDRTFLDHHDVEVNLQAGIATVRGGRAVPFRRWLGPHIVTLAFVGAQGGV